MEAPFLAHFQKGLTLQKEGRLDAALAEFQEALRIQPDSAPVHCSLGMVLADKDRTEDAITALRTAIRFDPRHAASHYNLGRVLEAKGLLSEALDAYGSFIENSAADAPQTRQVRDHTGKLRVVLERRGAAIAPRTLTLIAGEGSGPPQAVLPASGASEQPALARTLMDKSSAARGARSTDAITWRPGEVIDELFEVRSVLGEGGFGLVHKVRHLAWGLDLAVKAPRVERVASRQALESFVQEANTWVGLGLHPNIVTCYFVRVMGVPRIFIEYMDGGTLGDRLADRTGFDLKTSLDAAIQIARAMEYSHAKGLVHRDLKPGNCLLDSSGALKVTDFGLAKVGGSEEPAAADAGQGAKIARVKDATRTGRLGTPEYMAPEQWARPREAGPAADAWAFGAILYELFCGKKPFELADGEPADSFYVRLLESNWSYDKPDGLPESVAGLISLCLVLDPRGRTADFKRITATLESAYQKEMGSPYFREKVHEVPPMAETLNNQGVSMADLGRNEEALRLFDLALKLDPTQPAAVHNHWLVGKGESYERGLIVASAKEKRGADMLARLLERKKSHPKDLEPRYLLAMAHAREGNAPEARKELDEAAALCGNSPILLRAQRRLQAGDMTPASELSIALPKSTEDTRAAGERFQELLSRAREETAFFWHGKAYATALRARSIGGYERDPALMEVLRRLGAKGVRTRLRGAWQRFTFRGSERALSLAVLADGVHLLSGHEDTTIRLWDISNGARVRVFGGQFGPMSAFCAAPHGCLAFWGGANGTVSVWDIAAGRLVKSWAHHAGPVRSLCMVPEGRFVVSGGEDKTIRVTDPAGGAQMKVLQGHVGAVTSVCVSPDGRLLISGSTDGDIRFWELGADKPMRAYDAGPIRALALSPDGRCLLSVGADKMLQLWDGLSGSRLKALTTPAAISSVDFTPEGRFLLSGGEDGTLRIATIPGLGSAGAFAGHKARVSCVRASWDGGFAFTAGADGIRCWELDWDCEFPEPQDWEDGAKPYLEAFLALRPGADASALLRKETVGVLMTELGRRGYGRLRTTGVREHLRSLKQKG